MLSEVSSCKLMVLPYYMNQFTEIYFVINIRCCFTFPFWDLELKILKSNLRVLETL